MFEGSEVILNFKGTLKKKYFSKLFSDLNPLIHRKFQLQYPISPLPPTRVLSQLQQWETIKVFSFHFPKHGEIFLSLFTST